MRSKGTALVTGGAKRIGKAISLYLAHEGYKIALHYSQSKTEAQATAAEIKKLGGKCEVFACDLRQEWETQALIAQVIDVFPDLNLLINNAAIFEPSNLRLASADSLSRHLNVNLKAPYLLISQFAQQGIRGQVINILDSRITRNDPEYLAYSLSKKALASLTELAAVDLAPRIRVNGIAPGIVLPPKGKNAAYLKRLIKQVPMESVVSISDIMKAIQFFIDNDQVTGQILYVDGGRHLRT